MTTTAVTQGRFLVEVAAVQRDSAQGLISVVRFGAEASVTVTGVSDTGERTVVVPVTAGRAVIAAAVFPGEPPPGRGDAEGFPVLAPPRAVHAELLRDLGVNADALSGYLGGGVVYTEVRSDGRTSTVVVGREDGGAGAEVALSLTPDEPVVGVPYSLVEALLTPP